MTASENFRTLNRRDLRLDLEELYAEYVACLDEERFEEWPEFFTDDAIYRIIPRENFEHGLPIATLHLRAKAICKTVSSPSGRRRSAPRYMRRLVSNIRILGWQDDRIEVRVNYAAFETLRDELTRVFSVGAVPRYAGGRRRQSQIQREAGDLRQRVDSQFTDLSAVTTPTALHKQSRSLMEVHNGGYQIADYVPTALRARKSFGNVGPYEQLDGIVHFAVDPSHLANHLVTDLKLAPQDANGQVHFSADWRLLRPVEPRRGNHRLLFDIPQPRPRSGAANISATDVLPLNPGPGQWTDAPDIPSPGVAGNMMSLMLLVSCVYERRKLSRPKAPSQARSS